MDKVTQKIMMASVALFAERGFERVTVREVVEASGVHMPTLYRKFQDKKQLYVAVVRYAIVRSSAEVMKPLSDERLTPEERLFGYVLVSLRQIVEHRPCTRILDRELLDPINPAALSDLIDEVVLPLYARVADVVRMVAPLKNPLKHAIELGSQAYAAAKLIHFRRHAEDNADEAIELEKLAAEIAGGVLSQARSAERIQEEMKAHPDVADLQTENRRLEALLTHVMADNVKLRRRLQPPRNKKSQK